ncbi:MAG TPA: phosphoribosylanthranilate isomerase [Anaeromyxobacteraceae bacterium]|nr:phosphoribosylanthranilate isomerase [Anaeromyxobacteraceae bacterium]
MSRVRAKVCGITRLEDALAAARLGADALGFNFWPGSKRFVTPAAAREIIRRLPPLVTPVGVFVNQPEDELRAVAAETGIQVLQLHGDEPPELCARLPLPVWKAVAVDRLGALSRLLSYEVQAFVLDTPSRGFGGSGRPFDWSLAEGVSEATPIVLAGGLTPENVADAIRAVRPWAVDVASGVESSPGVKDADRMARFLAAVREVALP